MAFAPGAEFGPAKKWPAGHYAELAAKLVGEGKRVWLFGSASDAPDCEAIASGNPAIVNLAGKTSLLDAIDLIALTEAMICNDSGLMHVACALGVPTVGIFGSTSPAFTPPLGVRARTVKLDLDCSPCFERTCPLGHLDCLKRISPDTVREALVA